MESPTSHQASRSVKTLSLCPALNVEKVAGRMLERQRTELLSQSLPDSPTSPSHSLGAISNTTRDSTTRGFVSAASAPSMALRGISAEAGDLSRRQSSQLEGSGVFPHHHTSSSFMPMDISEFSDEMDHALLPRRVSMMLLLEEHTESQCRPQRLKTRMEEMAEQIQQSRGGGTLSTQASVASTASSSPNRLTGRALHHAVFNSLKQNEKMLTEINSKSAVELEVDFRKDSSGRYEDNDLHDEGEDHPALNRLRNRQMYNRVASIRFQDNSNSGLPEQKMPDQETSRCMKSLKSLLIRDGIGDDSMSIRSNSSMRHVIDSFTSGPIKSGSMRRGEGSLRRSVVHTVLNGSNFPSIRGRNDNRFDQSILLSLEQSFAGMAERRLRQMEESIVPKRRSKAQTHDLLFLPNEAAPPRNLNTREGERYTGHLGRPSDIQKRIQKEKLLLIKANPAAFQPDVADKAEARHQTMIEVARMRFDDSVKSQMQGKEVDSFFKSLQGLRVARPFFLPPIYSKDKIERQQRVIAVQKVWSLDKSIFVQRMKETESRQLLDDEKIKSTQFDLDWQRVVSKERFRRQIGIVERGKSRTKKNAEEELLEVEDEISNAKDALRSIFTFYSCDNGPLDSDRSLVLTLDKWMTFCLDVGLMDPPSTMTRNDLQRIFAAVNFEESDGDSAENVENDDNGMMRFEFLEGIVRTAFGRFIFSGEMKDASDACQMFIDKIVIPRVPPEALVDPNDFRVNRLYVCEVEAVLVEYQDLLFSCFKLYKSRDKAKIFWIEHWAAFLEAMCLMGPHTGLDRQEAKLLFFWSQCLVSDELKRRKRAVGLVFFDFIEAIGRLADFISPVSTEELLEMRPVGDSYLPGEQRERQLIILREMTMVGDRPGNRSRPGSSGAALSRIIDRPQSAGLAVAAGLVSKPSRPLAKKLTYLLEYIAAHSMHAWGGKNIQECAQRMMEEADSLSRGIELG